MQKEVDAYGCPIRTKNDVRDCIINNNLNQYGGKKLLLPKPELYVIYHNDRGDKPDSISLSKDIYTPSQV